jgi:hypothetical protein
MITNGKMMFNILKDRIDYLHEELTENDDFGTRMRLLEAQFILDLYIKNLQEEKDKLAYLYDH